MNTSKEELLRLGSIAASLVHDVSHLVHTMGYENVERIGLKLNDSPALYQLEQVLANTKRQLVNSSDVTKFSLLEAVRNVHLLLKTKLMLEKIDFRCEYSEEVQNFFVLLNQAQIEQMLMNFLLNSCAAFSELPKNSRRRRKIILKLSHLPAQKQIQLTIKDNGCGMTTEKLEEWISAINPQVAPLQEENKFIGLGKFIISKAIYEAKARGVIESKLGRGTKFNLYFWTA